MIDLIIIGAGPAGSAAAVTAARAGLKTTVYERRFLPRNKPCSGMLIEKSVERVHDIFGCAVPRGVTCAPSDCYGTVLTVTAEKRYSFRQNAVNVWRSAFDAFLAERAARAGAKLCDGTVVTDIEQEADGVTVTSVRKGVRRVERARYVVDAEGASGVLRWRLTNERPLFTMTEQAFYEGTIELDPHWFYAYLQPALTTYDAWLNVKDGLLVLGVSGGDKSRLAADRDRFLAYMAAEHGLRVTRTVRAERWPMPRVRAGYPTSCGMGRILFAGEIAGLLNPMGEGISSALESGRAAAAAVCAHIEDSAAVRTDYAAAVETLRGYMVRQWNLVGHLTDKFSEMRV